jgi:hypothetical protein
MGLTLPAAELFATETGEPLRYVGPVSVYEGVLQIVAGEGRTTLCGLPTQPHWAPGDPAKRKVCRLCREQVTR